MKSHLEQRPADSDRPPAIKPDAPTVRSRRLIRAQRIPQGPAEQPPVPIQRSRPAQKKYPAGYFFG
jgi:hypothetical protein